MKKKILYIIGIALILTCMACQVVNAFSFTPTITPSKSVVQEENEFTVKIKISNLDAGNGINKFSGILEYDKEIFEEINSSCVEGLNRWESNYDSDTQKITVTKESFVNEEQEIVQIAFKAKRGTYGKSGAITLKNIVANSSESDISASNISISISIGENSSEDNTSVVIDNQTTKITPITTSNDTNNVVPNNTVNNTANNVTNNTVNNVTNSSNKANNVTKNNTNNVVNGTVPYTGVDDTVAGLIIAVIAVALVFYFKIAKINEDLK